MSPYVELSPSTGGGPDEVFEYASLAAFPATGTAETIYVAQDTNNIYRWAASGGSGTPTSITQTGSALHFPLTTNAQNGTVSSTITVPADAEIVIVGLSNYNNASNTHLSMGFTKGGVLTAMNREGGADTNNNWETVLFWLAAPDTGTNKTLGWSWTSTTTDVNNAYSVTFWKGIDTASPTRGSTGVNGPNWPRNTATLTCATGDKIVAFAGFYYGAGGGGGDVTAWNNLTELTEITNSGPAEGAWATGSPTGNTTVGVQSCTGSEGGIAAVVLKPAMTGGGGAGYVELSPSAGSSYTDEQVDDRVAALIQNGTGITWAYNDASGTLTPTVTVTAVPPATATPLVESGAGAVGVATKYAREDHVHPAGPGGAIISDTAPVGAAAGSFWWESDTGITYLRFADANSSQWVAIASGAAPQAARKNYILNGAMMVSQENGATAVTTNGFYPVDQFCHVWGHGGNVAAQQVVGLTPGGSPNRIRVTVTGADAAVAAGDIYLLTQRIEGQRLVPELRLGTASARTVTLQFGCKGPAGTYCASIRNGAGNRGYVAEFVISAGEANTDVMKSVVISLDTAGTWAGDNTAGMEVSWCLMAGTNFQATAGSWVTTGLVATSSQFNLFATNGNVFELFDVSLTEGSVAPPFVVPDYAQELAACQRYWWRCDSQIVDTGAASQMTIFPTTMRANPTITGGGAGFSTAALTPTAVQLFQTARAYQDVRYNARL